MNKRSSATARIVAVAVLVGAFVLVVVVVGGALGGGSSDSSGHGHGGKSGHHAQRASRHTPKTYTIESGDTLISIAHHTGVPVFRIEELNPEVDPQILIAGETLKLR
jgi:LysM repeat protein